MSNPDSHFIEDVRDQVVLWIDRLFSGIESDWSWPAEVVYRTLTEYGMHHTNTRHSTDKEPRGLTTNPDDSRASLASSIHRLIGMLSKANAALAAGLILELIQYRG